MPRKGYYDRIVKNRFDEIEAWLRDGMTDAQIANRLRISPATLIRYKNEHEEFAKLMKRTKDYVDNVEMVGAYKRRAEGYTVETTRKKYIYKIKEDGTTQKILVSEEVKEVHVPGDARAMENWLRVRQKDTWGGDTVQETADSGVIVLQERDDG
jgi:transposase